MKQIQIKTTGIVALALLATTLSCNAPTKNAEATPLEAAQESLEPESNFLQKIQSIESAPCNAQQTALAISEFKNAYELDLSPVKLVLVPELIALLQSNAGTPDNGLVFHYGLSDPDSLPSIHYIMGPGTQDRTTEVFTASAFPAGANGQNNPHYILLDAAAPNGAFRHISVAEYCQFTANYFHNFLMKYGGFRETVKNIPQHPFLVYHQGAELNKFYVDNAPLNPTHFYVHHGADTRSPLLPKFHLPFLQFGDATGPFELAQDNAANYTNKSLDVGHPCPPFCGTAQIPVVKCD